jgi:hypothetical protein
MALGSNKPIILFCAENFGFGPAGLACAVAEEFSHLETDCELWFAGSGVSRQLAITSSLFQEVINWEPHVDGPLPDSLKKSISRLKYVLSAVSPSAVKPFLGTNIPVGYIEPLLWFFDEVPSFLSKVKHFFIQDFDHSRTHITRLGLENFPIVHTGWITQTSSNEQNLQTEAEFISGFGNQNILHFADNQKFVLLNFGGVENIFSGPSRYPEVVTDLVLRTMQELIDFRPVVCIGGGSTVKGLTSIFTNNRVCWSGGVSPHMARRLVQKADDYLLSCGLASLVELATYRSDGFGLPSQNYSQHLQIRAFRQILDGWQAFDWCDSSLQLNLAPYLPESDGVARIKDAVSTFVEQRSLQEEFSKRLLTYFKERTTQDGAKVIAREISIELKSGK